MTRKKTVYTEIALLKRKAIKNMKERYGKERADKSFNIIILEVSI